MSADQLRRFLNPDSGRIIVTRAGQRALRLVNEPYFKALPVWAYDPDPDHGDSALRGIIRIVFFQTPKKRKPRMPRTIGLEPRVAAPAIYIPQVSGNPVNPIKPIEEYSGDRSILHTDHQINPSTTLNEVNTMSDDYTQNSPADSGQEQSKHRKPDQYVLLEMQQGNGRKKLMDVGELWEGKNGYHTGNTIYGRMVIQPREQRETLRQMREQKAQNIEQGQSKEIER